MAFFVRIPGGGWMDAGAWFAQQTTSSAWAKERRLADAPMFFSVADLSGFGAPWHVNSYEQTSTLW